MNQYIYHGQNEKEFYNEFIHNVRCDYLLDPTDDNDVTEPLGVIIVPKDYDTCWISKRKFYLGWKIVIAPVAYQFIKK